MRKTSYRTWGSNKDSVPTIWGSDWAICGAADHVIITLCPYPCYIQETLIVTPNLQVSQVLFQKYVICVAYRDIVYKLESKIIPNPFSIFLDNIQLTYYELLRCFIRSWITECKLCLTIRLSRLWDCNIQHNSWV